MPVLEKTIEAAFSPLLRTYTLKEFWELPELTDRSHYDLIGGFLFMVPPPDPPHDDIDARLKRSLFEFLIGHNIEGDVLHPRAAIYRDLEVGTYLEPDMMYVSQELKQRMGRKRIS